MPQDLPFQSVDPVGQFLIQAYLAGMMPGQPVSNFHTVLSQISPSMQIERAGMGMPVPEQIGLQYPNLTPEQIQQITEMQTGLRVSPLEQQKSMGAMLMEMFKQQPAMMQAETGRRKLEEVEKPEAAAKGVEAGAKAEWYKSLKEAKEYQKQAGEVLRNPQATPGDQAWAKAILGVRDPQQASQVVGLLRVMNDALKRGDASLANMIAQNVFGPGVSVQEVVPSGYMGQLLRGIGMAEPKYGVGPATNTAPTTPEQFEDYILNMFLATKTPEEQAMIREMFGIQE